MKLFSAHSIKDGVTFIRDRHIAYSRFKSTITFITEDFIMRVSNIRSVVSSVVRNSVVALLLAMGFNAGIVLELFAVVPVTSSTTITEDNRDNRRAESTTCFGPAASSVMQKARAGQTLTADELALASQCQDQSQGQDQSQSQGDQSLTGTNTSENRVTGGAQSLTGTNTLTPTTTSSATGGNVGDTRATIGNISPQTESAAKSFAQANPQANVGDLSQKLGVSLETAQKLNNQLQLGLTNTSSNAAKNGNVTGTQSATTGAQQTTAGSPVSVSGDQITSTTKVDGDTTLVEGNNGLQLGNGNTNTFGRKFEFTVCAATVKASDTAAVTPIQLGGYFGRNGFSISVPLVQKMTEGVAPTQNDLSMAILAVASRQGANCNPPAPTTVFVPPAPPTVLVPPAPFTPLK